MMQALFETIFDVLYLSGVIIAGIILILRGKNNPLLRKFGIMAVVLGVGDSFHLIPRMIALWGSGLEANATPLGIGKLITSVTMTIFYLILYYIWRERYSVKGYKGSTYTIWGLTIARIALCLLPQNQWTSYPQPLLWGIIRNIPFAIMGIIIIVLFWQKSSGGQDPVFRFMPLAITLSFGFYVPVVLFAEMIPLIGMLMIPKTLAYVWVVIMGWNLQKQPTILSKQST